jgi:multidrug efflux pump
VISAFNSLTLSPALSALLLRPREKGQGEVLPRLAYALAGGWLAWRLMTPEAAGRLVERLGAHWAWHAGVVAQLAAAAPWIAAVFGGGVGWGVGRPLNAVLGRLFRLFNDAFTRTANGYLRGVGTLLRTSVLVLVVYCGLLLLTYWSYLHTPKGFVPTQDMGYLMVALQLPDAASAERTLTLAERVENICKDVPGISSVVTYNGNSFLLNVAGSNFSTMFVNLDDFDERRTPELYADAIVDALRKKLTKEIPEAQVFVVGAAPIRGIGRTGGFKFVLEDRADLGLRTLEQQTRNLMAKAGTLPPVNGRPPLMGLTSVFRANAPQMYVDTSRKQCMTMNVPLGDLNDTLQTYLGSLYVNDFNLYGRTWEVIVQADAPFRIHKEAVGQLKVRNRTGGMVPVGALASVRDVNGPLIITRYNTRPAASIMGSTAVGISSRQGIDLMAKLAEKELCTGMGYEWTEMAYFEVQAGNKAMGIFAIAVLMVFLVLAAQYESWSLPLAVILVVPMCLLCAIVGVSTMPLLLPKTLIGGGTAADINIFTQIGFVVLVGLASKNAILIVEFAKHQREEGASGFEATLAACKLRLRPIVMTSAAFILGALPLLVSRGAGAEMRRTLGTAVFCGMLGVTLFGIFLTPVFFYVIDWLGQAKVFQSRGFRITSQILIIILTFGWLWLLIKLIVWAGRQSGSKEPIGPLDELGDTPEEQGPPIPNP